MTNGHAPILIAGGSIAGLTIANLLELAGINYLVLEKYHKIAPDLGASIGISPNSARILDQIGVWDKLQQLYDREDIYDSFSHVHADGRQLFHVEQAAEFVRGNFGYQLVFIDRQQLIQVLHANLKHKERVIVDQGIARVETHDKGVRVTTSSGQTFTGEVLVGADGIHSTVRSEMWRLGSQVDPKTWSMSELDEIPVEWRCIYGISKPNSRMPARNVTYRQGEGHSYLTMVGPQDRIYWFVFEKLERISRGLYEKIPRYTNADLEGVVAKYGSEVVAGSLTLRDLYESRTSATLQALPEMTLPRWHFGSMVLIGDAAHKYNPILGQGGAQAIEDAAVLVNLLRPLLSSTSTSHPTPSLNSTTLHTALQTFQSLRLARATTMQQESHLAQAVDGLDGRWHRFLAHWIIPYVFIYRYGGETFMTKKMGERVKGAAKAEFIGVPERVHRVLFDDENKDKKSTVMDGLGWGGGAAAAVLTMVVCAVAVSARVGWVENAMLRGMVI